MSRSGWDKVKGVIATVAPGLATALGGPLAGQAVAVITAALGLGPNEDEKAIQILSQSPDALLKLKLAELEFRRYMTEAGVKLEELDVQDRASARLLASARGMWPQVALSLLYSLGYFGVLIGLLSGHFHVYQEGHDLLLGLVGALSAGQVQVLNFWFGSTSGGARKDELLAAK